MSKVALEEGFTVPAHSLYRARDIAISNAEADYKASFQRLEDWVKKFNNSNLGVAEVSFSA